MARPAGPASAEEQLSRKAAPESKALFARAWQRWRRRWRPSGRWQRIQGPPSRKSRAPRSRRSEFRSPSPTSWSGGNLFSWHCAALRHHAYTATAANGAHVMARLNAARSVNDTLWRSSRNCSRAWPAYFDALTRRCDRAAWREGQAKRKSGNRFSSCRLVDA